MCNHTLLRFPLRIQVRIPNLLTSLGHTVSRLTVILTDIRSISVRIVGTKFARTDVPESTSARVLESLEPYDFLTQRPKTQASQLQNSKSQAPTAARSQVGEVAAHKSTSRKQASPTCGPRPQMGCAPESSQDDRGGLYDRGSAGLCQKTWLRLIFEPFRASTLAKLVIHLKTGGNQP